MVSESYGSPEGRWPGYLLLPYREVIMRIPPTLTIVSAGFLAARYAFLVALTTKGFFKSHDKTGPSDFSLY